MMRSMFLKSAATRACRTTWLMSRNSVVPCVFMLMSLPAAALPQESASEATQMFRSLDRNGDSQLSNSDIDAGANRQMIDQIFQMAGKGANDSVSRDEFQRVFDRHRNGNANAPRGGNPSLQPEPHATRTSAGGLAESLLQVLDTDRDGQVSRDEWTRFGRLWSQLDRNNDMHLSAEELASITTPTPASRTNRDRSEPSAAPESSTGANRGTTNASSNASSSITGTWRGWVVHGTGEVPNTGEMEVELVISADRIVARELNGNRARGGLGSGTYTLNADGPGTLDADQTEGPETGRHFRGVYELNGHTLRWCVTGRNRQRPTTMATDRGNYLLVLQKQ